MTIIIIIIIIILKKNQQKDGLITMKSLLYNYNQFYKFLTDADAE
jgi:hypothetical protein